jgi:group II intron reverse transcriptase/maturase
MNNVSEERQHVHKLAKRAPRTRFAHLWEQATDPRWVMQAGAAMRSNPGRMTAGIDATGATDITPERLQRLSARLRTGQYRPKPVRWVYSAKSHGQRRPLGIPTLEDRMVQQALRMLMEPSFEADVSPCSHGVRRHRRTHTAVRAVARMFPRTTWTRAVDLVGCFDTIPHGRLMRAVGQRIAEGKVLKRTRAWLAAGSREHWPYHRTDRGTPPGGVLSPRLCNVFLHQLEESMLRDLRANQPQRTPGENARRNPASRTIAQKLMRLRRQRKPPQGPAREAIITARTGLERHRRAIPDSAQDKKHPSNRGSTRYAAASLLLVQGTQAAAQALKENSGKKVQELGVARSEEQTKRTPWRHHVTFLGYHLHGKRARKGTSLWPLLRLPGKKRQGIKEALRVVGGYHPLPEIDIITQMSAMFRGWCHYDRYATAPQAVFSDRSRYTWWRDAHDVARKHRRRMAQMIQQERQAGRRGTVTKNGRRRNPCRVFVGGKTVPLDLFPPRTGQIRKLATPGPWTVALTPVSPMNWQSGRRLATRTAALERAKGPCERCGEQPVAHVHPPVALRGKTFLARVLSDSAQRDRAQALCQGCHLEVHGGSYAPRQRKGQVG